MHDGLSKRDRRNRDAARHAYGDSSPLGFDDSQSDSISAGDSLDPYGGTRITNGSNNVNTGRPDSSSISGGAILAGDDRDRRQRRRRRAEHSRSHSVGVSLVDHNTGSLAGDEYTDDFSFSSPQTTPDVGPSDVARTSVDSDRPMSAAEEKEFAMSPPPQLNRSSMARDNDSVVSAAESGRSTPTQARASPFAFLATRHANISHGDLTTLARRRTGELEGAIAQKQAAAMREGRQLREDEYYDDDDDDNDNGGGNDDDDDDEHRQEYGRGQHGEGENEDDDDDPYGYRQYPQDTYAYQQHVLSPIPSEAEISDAGSVRQQLSRASYRSDASAVSGGAISGLAPSSMAPSNYLAVGGFHNARESEVGTARSAYGSMYGVEESEVGQKPVNRVAANPRLVHVPLGVESAVASLVDGSVMAESHVGPPRGQQPPRGKYDAYEEEYDSEEHDTPTSAGGRLFDEEYEPDDYGHKQRFQPLPLQPSSRRQSPTGTEAAITAGAVAALRAKSKQDREREQQDRDNGAAVTRAFSFQRRGNDEASLTRSSAAGSSLSLDADAAEMPDWAETLPEADFMTQSAVDAAYADDVGRQLDGEDGEYGEDGRRTPTQQSVGPLTTAAMAAVLGDYWDRSDEDRKRDTLVTNPYEDQSPVAMGAPLGLTNHAAAAPGFAAATTTTTTVGSPGLHVNKLLDGGYLAQTHDSGGSASSTPRPAASGYLRDMANGGTMTPGYEDSFDVGMDSIESPEMMALVHLVSLSLCCGSSFGVVSGVACVLFWSMP